MDSKNKQLIQRPGSVGHVALLLQSRRIFDLPLEDSPLHRNPLVNTALDQLHGLRVFFRWKEVLGCHALNVEPLDEGHLTKSLPPGILKHLSRVLALLQTLGLDSLANILGGKD